MRRPIIHLFVAVLTFAIGTIASTFLYGVLSPSAEKANNSTASVSIAPPPPRVVSETGSSRCGCNQSTDEDDQADEGPAPFKAPINAGVLNGKAVSLPKPSYPDIGRAAHASGSVVVHVVISERGCIASARAISGHPLLQAAAVQAAYKACFTPTRLSGQPVKVAGDILYNFVLQ